MKKGVFESLSVYKRILLLFCLVLFGGIIFSIIGSFVDYLLNNKNFLINPNYIIIQFFTSIGFFLFPTILYIYLFSNIKFSRFLEIKKFEFRDSWSIIMLILIVIVAIPFLVYTKWINSLLDFPESLKWLESWIRELELKEKNILVKLLFMETPKKLILNIIVLSITPAILEEFLFRGIIQREIYYKFNNIHFAIIITSIIFSAMHLQILNFIPRFFMGIILGYVFYFSRKIWFSILLHFFNNTFVLLVEYFEQKNIVNVEIFKINFQNEIEIVFISFLVIILIMIGFFKLNKHLNY